MRGWGLVRRRPGRDGWQIDVYVDGRRIRRSYTTKGLAQAGLKRLQYVRATGGHDPTEPGPTYGDLAAALLREYAARGHSDRTLASYRLGVAYVLEHWRDRRIDRTRPGDVTDWIHELQRLGLSSSTIRLRCDRLAQFHHRAERDGLCSTTPCSVPRPKLVTRRRDPLPENDLARLLEHAADPRARAVVLLAADAGLRAAEIAELELRDVDLAHGWITVRRGKGGRERAVPILTRRLDGALRALDGQRVLRSSDREASQRAVVALWRRVLGRAPELHRLRHRFATVALGAPDVAVDEVRRWLGHATLAMTARYVHARHAPPPPGVGLALEGPPDGHRARVPRGTC